MKKHALNQLDLIAVVDRLRAVCFKNPKGEAVYAIARLETFVTRLDVRLTDIQLWAAARPVVPYKHG